MVDIGKGLEIASIADVPAGTGLGSSSSFTVCLLHALNAYKGKFVAKDRLAQQACKIEIDILREPIGKQDQYAASYGGLNYIRFNSDGSVFVEPLLCSPQARRRLQKNLIMFYVGNERKASQILYSQKENLKQRDKYEMLQKMVGLADRLRDSLNRNKVKAFGEILHEGWLLKKGLSDNISNPVLDDYYETALGVGAVGGKVLGAGGGGFLLFYCEPKFQNALRNALKLRELKFSFESEGTKIVYFDK